MFLVVGCSGGTRVVALFCIFAWRQGRSGPAEVLRNGVRSGVWCYFFRCLNIVSFVRHPSGFGRWCVSSEARTQSLFRLWLAVEAAEIAEKDERKELIIRQDLRDRSDQMRREEMIYR